MISIDDCRMPDGTLRKFTNLGSYPLTYITKDGGTLCPKCATEDGQTTDPHDPQWFLIGADVHYEGDDHCCDHCGEKLEPAYPSDDVLYIRPKLGGEWKTIERSDDPDSRAHTIHDLWNQEIREVSIDGVDYIIRDTKD